MSTRSTRLLLIVGSAVVSGVLALSSIAQSVSNDEGKRKVKTKVAPAYPELAKRMSVTGKVKVEVVIAPDGRVKSVRALGGHPLLVQACQDAVRGWKFMPGPEESTQVMECNFTSSD